MAGLSLKRAVTLLSRSGTRLVQDPSVPQSPPARYGRGEPFTGTGSVFETWLLRSHRPETSTRWRTRITDRSTRHGQGSPLGCTCACQPATYTATCPATSRCLLAGPPAGWPLPPPPQTQVHTGPAVLLHPPRCRHPPALPGRSCPGCPSGVRPYLTCAKNCRTSRGLHSR